MGYNKKKSYFNGRLEKWLCIGGYGLLFTSGINKIIGLPPTVYRVMLSIVMVINVVSVIVLILKKIFKF